MAYCAKCGVEVDNGVKKCPLCKFPIPDILVGEDKKEEERNYPKAENIYKEEIQKRKNQVFYSLFVSFAVAFIVFLFIKLRYDFRIVNYFILSAAFSMLYLFLFFGYLRINYSVAMLALTTLLFTWFLKKLTGGDWFRSYSIPIILISTADFYLILLLYRANKFRNKFIYIPVFILLYTTILCVGVNIIIVYAKKGVILLTWSAVVAGVNIGIILIMLGIYHKMPEKARITLRKKFHI
jgi:hypothetical protein